MEDPSSWQTEPAARDAAEARARHEANRAAWNEGAAHYTGEVEETIRFLRDGGSNLHPIEREMLGELRSWCRRAIHLQCASGRDTLSLLNEGVEEVVGVDISDSMIANAEQTTRALGLRARFIRCDIIDTPPDFDGGFDLVYTGRGAICWIHDLEAWSATVLRLLRPGGVLSLYEDHPATYLFDNEAKTIVPSGIDYFQHAESSQGWPASYIGDLEIPVARQSVKHERLWPMGRVVTSLLRVGLTIERFGEHPDRYWENFQNLRSDLRAKLPMTYSVLARKPS